MPTPNRRPDWVALIIAACLALASLALLTVGAASAPAGAQSGVVQPKFDPAYEPAVIDGEVKRDSILIRCGAQQGTMEFEYNAFDLAPRWFTLYRPDGSTFFHGEMQVGDVIVLPHEAGWRVGYHVGIEYFYAIVPGTCTPTTTTVPTTEPPTTTTPTTEPPTTTTEPPATTTTEPPVVTTEPPAATTTSPPLVTLPPVVPTTNVTTGPPPVGLQLQGDIAAAPANPRGPIALTGAERILVGALLGTALIAAGVAVKRAGRTPTTRGPGLP